MKLFERKGKMRLLNKVYRRAISPRGIFFITIMVLAIPNIALCVTERMSLLRASCNVILPLAAYILLMSASKKTGKMVWCLFPLIFLEAFQLVLLYLFGQSIISVDMFLNVVTTNASEVSELLGNLSTAIIMVVIINVPLLVYAVRSIIRKEELRRDFIIAQRKRGAALFAVGLLLLCGCYATDKEYSVRNDLYPVNVCYNLILAVDRSNATANYNKTSAGFSFNAESTRPADKKEVYVFVIGETARAMNFGIYGYNRETTPLLAKTEGLTVFDYALSQSNTTHKSVPMLLSAASAEDYDRIYLEKSIITAFKEAGFYTAFISNQEPNRSFIDIFGNEADYSRTIAGTDVKGQHTDDFLLMDELDKVLKEGHKKLFIVLHTYGSHFCYRDRYPREKAFFRPDDATEAKAKNRNELLNAYDNSIRHTDELLHSIITRLSDSGSLAAMVYTSDHGENIFDDSRHRFLHASPVPTYYDLRVPLIIWTSPAYRSDCSGIVRALNTNCKKSVSTNTSVFHTLLSIGGISTRFLSDSLSLASPDYQPGKRYFLNDHNRAITLDEVGVKPPSTPPKGGSPNLLGN